jgi:hypothetical protein
MPMPTRRPKKLQLDGLPTILANAAGMDIGAKEIVVAVPPDRDEQPVRAFATFMGETDQAILLAIVAGERDPVKLAWRAGCPASRFATGQGRLEIEKRTHLQRPRTVCPHLGGRSGGGDGLVSVSVQTIITERRSAKQLRQSPALTRRLVHITGRCERGRAITGDDGDRLLKYGEACEEERAEAYEQRRQERELRHLTRRATKLGYTSHMLATRRPQRRPEGRRRGGFSPVGWLLFCNTRLAVRRQSFSRQNELPPLPLLVALTILTLSG